MYILKMIFGGGVSEASSDSVIYFQHVCVRKQRKTILIYVGGVTDSVSDTLFAHTELNPGELWEISALCIFSMS